MSTPDFLIILIVSSNRSLFRVMVLLSFSASRLSSSLRMFFANCSNVSEGTSSSSRGATRLFAKRLSVVDNIANSSNVDQTGNDLFATNIDCITKGFSSVSIST